LATSIRENHHVADITLLAATRTPVAKNQGQENPARFEREAVSTQVGAGG